MDQTWIRRARSALPRSGGADLHLAHRICRSDSLGMLDMMIIVDLAFLRLQSHPAHPLMIIVLLLKILFLVILLMHGDKGG